MGEMLVPSLVAGGASILGGVMGGKSAENAANTAAAAQRNAAKTAADAARFTPVGTTTRFGQSQFGYDPTGRLNQAGYQLSPELQQQQDFFMAQANQGLNQYGMGSAYAQPMLGASQRMMGLGQQYLGSSPQEQAAKYFANQQALLNPSRMQTLSDLRNTLQQQGRAGLAYGGDGGLQQTNPELAAYYNAMAQQDAQLAAQADQAGQQYAQFGAGMMGSGGKMLGDYYGAQTAALQPYQTALGAAQGLESMGQGAMDLGTSLGAKTSTAGANQANALLSGGMAAAQSQQAANSYNPWATMLSGAGSAANNYMQNQQQMDMFNKLLAAQQPASPAYTPAQAAPTASYLMNYQPSTSVFGVNTPSSNNMTSFGF